MTVPKGGAGKTFLATNLGVFAGLRLREAKRTVCVVDANWQQADVGKTLNHHDPSITSLVRNSADMTPERIGRHLLYRTDLATAFLLGPPTPEDANPAWITPQLYGHVLDVLRHLYDYIILDTPVAERHHEWFSEFVLPNADFVVLPVAPNYSTIYNTDMWLRTVTQPKLAGGEGVSEDRVGIVLNRAEDDIGCSEEDVRAELAAWQFLGVIPESKEIKRAVNNDEIIASQNFVELNAALSRILYAITGEEVFRAGQTVQDPSGKSTGVGGLFSRFRKGR